MLEELFKLRDRVALLEKRIEAMELAQRAPDPVAKAPKGK